MGGGDARPDQRGPKPEYESDIEDYPREHEYPGHAVQRQGQRDEL